MGQRSKCVTYSIFAVSPLFAVSLLGSCGKECGCQTVVNVYVCVCASLCVFVPAFTPRLIAPGGGVVVDLMFIQIRSCEDLYIAPVRTATGSIYKKI